MLPSTPHSVDMRRRPRAIGRASRCTLITVHPRLPRSRSRRNVTVYERLRRRSQFISARGRRRLDCPWCITPRRLSEGRRRRSPTNTSTSTSTTTTSSQSRCYGALDIPLVRERGHKRFFVVSQRRRRHIFIWMCMRKWGCYEREQIGRRC